MKSKTIKVDYLARVEGEGAMYLKIKDHRIQDLKLRIYEPPRFFEAFLQGRRFSEVPDITARICGICPIAYQMSSVHAIEHAFGISIPQPIRELRRLIYCGEWIESHALHVYMLHAPDFLGYEDSIRLARDFPERVSLGLRLKKIGNQIVQLLGGREIHPINVRVGGFYKIPPLSEFLALRESLSWALEAAIDTVKWVAQFDFPEFEKEYEFVALSHPAEYAMNEGRLISNKGLDIAIPEYEAHFEEVHVPHSTALHSRIKDRDAYFVGPLARFNLNYQQLPAQVQALAAQVGLEVPCTNPFKSIIVRSLETAYACQEAIRIIDNLKLPETPALEVSPRAGIGQGCTEAPRGILYHRYEIDSQGNVVSAKIVPPTSQNQKTIEDDLRRFAEKHLDLPQEQLTWQCEQAIRNYDPCISCSTHFLTLHIENRDNRAGAKHE